VNRGLARSLRRPSAAEIGVVAAVVGLHYALNRLVPDRLLVPASLAGAAGVAAIARSSGASWKEQGLDPRDIPPGFDAGGPAAAAVATATAAGLFFERTRRFYWDERIIRQTHVETAYQSLVRIPLGTALGEEMIFRGSVPAILRRRFPAVIAGLTASAAFGAWHIIPTLDRISTSPLTRDTSTIQRTASTVSVVALTVGFGLGFWLLRSLSGSVVAPALAHAAANSVGLAGGWASAWIQREADRVGKEVRAGRFRPTPGG
jgi:membrane protease YdiL (CAAX protease family)